MFIEPSILQFLDFLKSGYLPSIADRTVHPLLNDDGPYYFTDFIDDQNLLEAMINHHSSPNQKYWHMNELVSALTADFDAASDASVRMSCMLLKSCGSINFGLYMEVNGYLVSYDLYYDFPCTK